MMKTYSVKQGDVKRETHTIDATDKILWRLAADIAKLLMGKHKAMFSRNADTGDSVTVINAEKIQVTGKKPQQKVYYWHSNYPGGLGQITYERLMKEQPERIITFAVYGMLPHNHLHDKVMKRLKVYVGPEAVKKKPEKPVARATKAKKSLIRNIPVEAKVAQKKEAKR
jgi:large subunit ribosomal protein L13